MGRRTRYRRRFVTSAPVKSIIRGSRSTFLPGFGDVSLHEVWRPFMNQLRRTNLFERAAGISFNIVMAIPPTLIFIFTLIPYLPISRAFISELFTVIRDVVPGEENNTAIISFLDDFLNRPRNELLSFGLLLALVFSSNAMMGIMRSFDKNYPGFYRRRTLQKRKTALLLTIGVYVLMFVCLLLLIAQGVVLQWIGIENRFLRLLITNARWFILLVVVFYVVSLIYRNGPALKEKWPFFTPGSVVATSLMFLATFGVSFYVNNFSNYNKLYGSIGAIFILMLLIYVNALMVLAGFELNVAIAHVKRQKLTVKAVAHSPRTTT
jgi:membrane protein